MTETREAVARAICRETCARMGEPACWQEVNGGDGLWPNPGCTDCHSMADAALAALSPGGDGGEHDGWLFFNPDAGLEWSAQHPVESGEVPDAEDVKPATAQLSTVELKRSWANLRDAEALIAALTAERDRLAEALQAFQKCVIEGPRGEEKLMIGAFYEALKRAASALPIAAGFEPSQWCETRVSCREEGACLYEQGCSSPRPARAGGGA